MNIRELDNHERQMAGILCACIRPEPHIGEHQIPCPSCRAAILALVDGKMEPTDTERLDALNALTILQAVERAMRDGFFRKHCDVRVAIDGALLNAIPVAGARVDGAEDGTCPWADRYHPRCMCGHPHASGPDGEDAGCPSCNCDSFRASPAPSPQGSGEALRALGRLERLSHDDDCALMAEDVHPEARCSCCLQYALAEVRRALATPSSETGK